LDAAGEAIPFRYRNGAGPYVTHRSPPNVNLPSGSSAVLEVAKYRCDVSVESTANSAVLTLPDMHKGLRISLRHGVSFDRCHEPPSTVIYLSPLVSRQRDL